MVSAKEIINIDQNGVSDYQLTTKSHGVFPIETPLSLDNSFHGKSFQVFTIAKKGLNENDIFQVYDTEIDRRIGWCIPVQALSSDNHDYASNPHFLKYSYIATRELLTKNQLEKYSKDIDLELNTLLLSDIYHEHTAALIISTETLPRDYCFKLERAIPSLIRYGYLVHPEKDEDRIEFTALAPTSEKLKLKMVSTELGGLDLLVKFYCKLFALEDKPELKFFYLYQLFEYLLDDVLTNEQDDIILKINETRAKSGNLKEALRDLGSITSEGNRLKKLFATYSSVPKSASLQLEELCDKLIKSVRLGKAPTSCDARIYAVRNSLFHEFWRFTEQDRQDLDSITHEILEVLETLLSSYSHPKNSL